MNKDWRQAEKKVEEVIFIIKEGASIVANRLTKELEACRNSKSFGDPQFQEAAEALYQLLTHVRGVSDIYVEQFTLAEWVNLLFDAAKSIEPFIESRQNVKPKRHGKKPWK